MDYSNPVIIRQMLLDNFKNPNFKVSKIDSNSFKIYRIDSPYCIDDITMGLKIDNDVLKKAVFSGKGCTISIAAANLICEHIENLKVEEVKNFIQAFSMMLTSGKINDENILQKTIIFQKCFKTTKPHQVCWNCP